MAGGTRLVGVCLLLCLVGIACAMSPLRGIPQEARIYGMGQEGQGMDGGEAYGPMGGGPAMQPKRGVAQARKHQSRPHDISDEQSLDLEEKPRAEPANQQAAARDASEAELNEQLDTGGYPYALHQKGLVGFGPSSTPSGGYLPGMYTPGIYPSGQAVGSSTDGQMFSDPGQFGWDLRYMGAEPEQKDGGRPLTKWMQREYNPGATPSSPRNLWVRESGDAIEENPGMYPFVRSPQNIMMHEGPEAYFSNGGAMPFYHPDSPWHPNHPANPLNVMHDPRSIMSPLHPDNPSNPYRPKDPYSPFFYRRPTSPYYAYNQFNLWSPGSAFAGQETATTATQQGAGMAAGSSVSPGQPFGLGLRSVLTSNPNESPTMMGPAMGPATMGPAAAPTASHAFLPHPSMVMGWNHGAGLPGGAFYGAIPSEDGTGIVDDGYGLPGNFPFMG